jgi:hypothetical protein
MIDEYVICYTIALCNAIWAVAWVIVTSLRLKESK